MLAGLTAWIRRQRLVAYVPRLFSYSVLTDKNGQLAELSVMNRGFKTEEAVEVTISPALKCDIVGSTNNDVVLKDNKLSIPRIGAGDDVTIILLVEGGVFNIAEITGCLSKESRGLVVGRFDQIPMTGPQRVGIVGVFVVVPAILILAYFGVTGYFEKKIEKVGEQAAEKATATATASATANAIAATGVNVVIREWNIRRYDVVAAGPIFDAYKSGKINLGVRLVTREGDVVGVEVSFFNSSDLALNAGISMDTQLSGDRIPSYARSLRDIFVAPGGVAAKSINVIVPEKSPRALDKNVYIEVHLRSADGDTLGLYRTFVVP